VGDHRLLTLRAVTPGKPAMASGIETRFTSSISRSVSSASIRSWSPRS
jgi:hypothetical protein